MTYTDLADAATAIVFKLRTAGAFGDTNGAMEAVAQAIRLTNAGYGAEEAVLGLHDASEEFWLYGDYKALAGYVSDILTDWLADQPADGEAYECADRDALIHVEQQEVRRASV